MNVEKKIAQTVCKACKELYGAEVAAETIQVQKTKKEFEGHLTVVVFPLLKVARKAAPVVAQQIGERLVSEVAEVEKAQAVGGFLNLTLSRAYWLGLLEEIKDTADFGIVHPTAESPLVMIEYSSPNTNKPLHLGHVRNNLLGWALGNVIAAGGNRVVRTNIVNDRGIHICKSMLAWKKWGNGATPETVGKKGDHLIGDFYVLFDKHYRAELAKKREQLIAEGVDEEAAQEQAERQSELMREAREMLVAWEAGDVEVRSLWAMMNEWVYEGFDQTYKALGVSFDKIYYESDTYLVGKREVERGLEEGLFFRKDDGSVWADLTGEGLDQKLLLRSDGTSVYMTQDIGTAKMRFEDYQIDKMVYVVGNEQNYHFQVLSILLDRLGFKWGKSLVHFSYGMVELPSGKMKSREGTVVDADDLIDEMRRTARRVSDEAGVGKKEEIAEDEKEEIARIVGLGALKYYLLKVDARKNMMFNPEESIDFNGNTGPFIQYTYARIRSVLRNAQKRGIAVPTCVDTTTPLSEVEQDLIAMLYDFKQTVRQAAQDYAPADIANYCYELVKRYNQFYHDLSILGEDDEQKRGLRLLLSGEVAKVVRTGMGLLGIEVPERM